ncbi:MAG: hypothetical protein WBO23_12170 [Burkholderiales bacterium]
MIPTSIPGVVMGVLLAASTTAAAQDRPLTSSSLTLYGGYRMGGRLTESTTEKTIVVDEHASFALALDIALDPGRQTEVFFSHQKSALSSSGFSPSLDGQPISIDYFHIGGTSFLGKVIAGTYVVGGIGATRAKPDFGGLHAATRLSLNLGLGYLLPLGGNLAARFEARGYGTLVESEGGLFCGGDSGCLISVKGRALYQTEVLLGLSGRF